MSETFYKKLSELSDQICKDFSDDLDRRSIFREDKYIDSNFPWLYVHFTYEGGLSLNALKEIEKRYQAFCAVEGGSLESITLSRRGLGFVVKLVYVPGKKKAPVETGAKSCNCASSCKAVECAQL